MSKTESDDKSGGRKKKPFVGVIFKCCNIYSRIYLNKQGTAFVGWCPKCGAKMEVLISPTGSKSNFFIAE